MRLASIVLLAACLGSIQWAQASSHRCELTRHVRPGEWSKERFGVDRERKINGAGKGQSIFLKIAEKSSELEIRTVVPRAPASDQDHVLRLDCDQALNCQGSRKTPGRPKPDALRIHGGGADALALIGDRPMFRYSLTHSGFVYRYIESVLDGGRYTGFELDCRKEAK
mgnify:CR=1 FL=1